jgi:hypothetical protein
MNGGGFGVNADKFKTRSLADHESAQLQAVLGPVLRDVRATGGIMPDIREEAHEDLDGGVVSAWLANGASAGGRGIRVLTGLSPAEQLAGMAAQVQEWELEELAAAGRSATWPQCPVHPNSHPLSPEAQGGEAVWVCPRIGRRIARIGELDAAPQG